MSGGSSARGAAAPGGAFDPACSRCARLAEFLAHQRGEHPDYYNRPVPSFGPRCAPLLVVGLAPGLHGANATGRPFTGDHAGILLYATLHAHGFASQPESRPGDRLRMRRCRITNAVRCVPPGNKPTASEVRRCNDYLASELAEVPVGGAVVALGRIAHDAVLRALGLRAGQAPFAHGARHAIPGDLHLFDSYHCSRYNTQTRRLTPAMFDAVFAAVRTHLGARGA